MTTEQNDKINALFIELEAAEKSAAHFNNQSLYSENPLVDRESYGVIFGETLEEIVAIQRRLIRAFYAAGEFGELADHVEAGTLPRFAIQTERGRRSA